MTREERRQRRAFVRLTDALGAYLEVHGWRAIVVGGASISGAEIGAAAREAEGQLGKFEFSLAFTGGRLKKPETAAPRRQLRARRRRA